MLGNLRSEIVNANFLVIEEVDIRITVNCVVVSDASSKIGIGGGSLGVT